MIEDALSFWTEIQRYEDMLAADANSHCFAPLSELYRKLGLLDDAISVAQKGCTLHPDYPGGFFALATACYDKGMAHEAREALERVLSLKPDHILALKLLGQLYVEQNEVELAGKILRQVMQQDPDDLESSLLLSSISPSGAAQAAEVPAPAAPAVPSHGVSTAVLEAEDEEELLEDLEVIEDLEEVLPESEDQELADAVAAAMASPGIGLAEEAAVRPSAAKTDEDEDLWAIEDLEETEVSPAAGTAQPQQKNGAPDPLTTATLAELYVSQGFIDKALNIYDELLQAHPTNQQYRLRCEELREIESLQHLQKASTEPQPVQQARPAPAAQPAPSAPAAPAAPAVQQVQPPEPAVLQEEQPSQEETTTASAGELEAELTRWLENIRRRKNGL